MRSKIDPLPLGFEIAENHLASHFHLIVSCLVPLINKKKLDLNV